MGKTKIEWTQGDDGALGKTWNPTRGCSRVSQGCVNCLAPGTRILYEDFTWRPIGDAVVGDRLLAFDETNKLGHPRKFRTASIERVWASYRETRRLITQQSDIVTTAGHRWLRRFSNRWPTTDQLQIGKPLRQIGVTPTPLITQDYRHGYLAGMTEGDGTFRYEPGQRSDKLGFPQAYWRVALIEKDEEALGRLVAYLAHFGIESYVRPFTGGSIQCMLKVEVRSLGALEKLHSLLTKELNSTEFARGFVSGFFDAEGSGEASLRFSQVDRSTLQRISAYGKALGFQIDVEPEYKPGRCSEARLTGSALERLRFLSTIQNALSRKAGIIGMKQQQVSDTVIRVENGTATDVVDIQTSTGTFFAEGLATHNCYAERQALRFSSDGDGFKPDPFHGFVAKVNGHASWTGKVELIESMLDLPLRWKKSCRIFVNSMSDLFHEALSFEDIDKVFTVMVAANQHTYQILTKRPKRMLEYFRSGRHDNGNGPDRADYHLGEQIWLGVSVEDQATADERIPLLLRTPASKRFVSYEPALGPVDFNQRGVGTLLDWIIVGGESGPGARRFDLEWMRSTVEQCKAAGVAVFCKQIGSNPYWAGCELGRARPGDRKGGCMEDWPHDLRVRQFPFVQTSG
jgi:protein gp37